MGRLLLVGRLALRDLRRRWAEAVLLLLALLAATTTLTLGLVLHGVTDDPYQATRDATAGPDVVATVSPPPDGAEPADLSGLEALIDEPGVVGHSGPYPVISAELAAGGRTSPVQAEGREATAASIDRPELVEGRWVGDGEVVIEAAFADALGLHAGDRITLDGRPFRIAGVAVTAAIAGGTAPLYSPPLLHSAPGQSPDMEAAPGLVWLTQPDVGDLAEGAALSYVLNLRLADPDAAQAFVDGRNVDVVDPGAASLPPWLQSWQEILANANNITRNTRNALVTGAWLLGVLAVAGVAVLALRASRSSTIRALDGSARPPRRWAGLIALSARLPLPLLLGLRVAARRPRRMALAVASVAVTVAGIVAALSAHAQLGRQEGPVASSAFEQLRSDRLDGVLLVVTAMLVALAVVNAVFITWATVLDTRHASARARALGVTPREVSAGLAAAQALPALAGAVLGIPAGLALFSAVSPDEARAPPLWALVALVPATAGAIALLTSIPARLAARQRIAEALDAEPA